MGLPEEPGISTASDEPAKPTPTDQADTQHTLPDIPTPHPAHLIPPPQFHPAPQNCPPAPCCVGPAAYAPNMFGDIFGAGGTGLLRRIRPQLDTQFTQPRAFTVGGPYLAPGTQVPEIFPVLINPVAQPTFTFVVGSNQPGGTVPTIRFGRVITENFFSTGPATPVQVPGGLAVTAESTPLLPNQQDRQAVLAEAIRQFGPGGTLEYLPDQSMALFNRNLQAAVLFTNYLYTLPGIQVPTLLIIPTPTRGSVVGFTKVSEDNSPLPRDRIIFGFDYYEDALLTASGVDVRRFSPGFEKAFLGGRMSLEVRFPFATTLSTSLREDGLTSTNTEFGNIHVTLKALLIDVYALHLSTGAGLGFPTGDDITVQTVTGAPLLRIRNDAVTVTPFLAALWTPGPRFFVQSWLQFSTDTDGNSVQFNPRGLGLREVGRLRDQTLLQADLQVGYWWFRSSSPVQSLLQGLASFVELHYNWSLGDPNFLQQDSLVVVGAGNDLEELNLSAGIVAQLRDNLNLSVGAVAPLRETNDRNFDWQFGLRLNYFFGATGRARAEGIPPSTF
jgi:hypothetical protein